MSFRPPALGVSLTANSNCLRCVTGLNFLARDIICSVSERLFSAEFCALVTPKMTDASSRFASPTKSLKKFPNSSYHLRLSDTDKDSSMYPRSSSRVTGLTSASSTDSLPFRFLGEPEIDPSCSAVGFGFSASRSDSDCSTLPIGKIGACSSAAGTLANGAKSMSSSGSELRSFSNSASSAIMASSAKRSSSVCWASSSCTGRPAESPSVPTGG